MKYVFCFLILIQGSTLMSDPSKKHFDGNRYYNLDPVNEKNIWDMLKWVFSERKKTWPTEVQNTYKPQLPTQEDAKTAYVTYVNHASFLIQINGTHILTDPMFSERASPVSWAGPKRVRKPGIAIDELPKIDVVLVSHNHYDHLDIPSLKLLSGRFHPQILVPKGNAKLLESEGIDRVTELDWWQIHDLGSAGTIQLTPCQHWSARGLFDRFASLWGAYFINVSGWKLLFIGDAGYSAIYKEIYKRFGAMDISLIPIGAYEPRWFMKDFHMNPEEAVLAHIDLHSRNTLGSHFGTFQLTNEGIDEPPQDLLKSLKEHEISQELFQAPGVGRTYIFKN